MTKNKSRLIAQQAAGSLLEGLGQAEESANALGNVATGSGRKVACSVGQLVYITNTRSTANANKMSSLPTTAYFINVVNQENKQVQAFKTIKN